jgi:alkylation response protein AidB-like acyl-CoA dehydrogenase
VQVQGYRTLDGMRAAEIKFVNVKIGADSVLGEVDAALPVLERAADFAVSALCAEAVGAMEALNAATFEYLKTRQQFGRAIGSFQALQHRAVDMFIHCEQSRSMAYLASVKVQSRDEKERKRTVSAAKIQIGRSGRVILQEAIQLHGGMGVSNELAAGHYAKRLAMINATLGDVDYHSERLANAA